MQKALILGIITLLCTPLLAQIEVDSTRRFQLENAQNKERAILMSMGSFQRLNSYVNPLAASGLASGIIVGTEAFKGWGIRNSEFRHDSYISLADANEMATISFAYSEYWHKRVFARADNRLFVYAGVGACVDAGADVKLTSSGNNYISFKGGVQALPSAMFKYRFEVFGQRLDFSQQVSFPLLGFMALPRYGYSGYTGYSDLNVDIGSQFTSLHNNIGMNARTYIDWRRRKNGKERNSFVRLGYTYDAYRIKYETRHQMGCHQFAIGMVRKF